MEKSVLQTSQNASLAYLRFLTALVLARDFVFSGMKFCNVLRFFAGEAIFSNDELGSQSGSFLPATEYFFQERTTHKSVSYLLPVFRYYNQRQRKLSFKPVYR